MLFMTGWILQHAPEYQADLASGKEKVSPLYRRLKAQFDGAVLRYMRDHERPDGAELMWWREGGEYRFRWESNSPTSEQPQ
jgi:hypothetical protein